MKKYLILGGTSGIGLELSKTLAERNLTIIACGRRKMEDMNNITYISLDVKEINFSSKLNSILDAYKPDIAIYSTGTGFENEKLNTELDMDVIGTNIIGFTIFCNNCIKYFENRGFGHLIGITSVAALISSAEAPSYSASKAYQMKFLQGLRMRSRKNKNIIITEIRPGFVRTAMMKGKGHFWILEPEMAAKRIVSAIDRGVKISYISLRWKILGLLIKTIPEKLL
jgi:short-subunit dehydrogenase